MLPTRSSKSTAVASAVVHGHLPETERKLLALLFQLATIDM